MSVKEDLIAMRELLTPPGRWCQQAAFLDSNGYCTLSYKDAARMCIMGASVAIAEGQTVDDRRLAIVRVMRGVLDAMTGKEFDIASWNDDPERTHQEVLDFLDRCIADCEPETTLCQAAAEEAEQYEIAAALELEPA